MDEIVVVAANRTAIAKMGKSFKNLSAVQIASELVNKMLKDFPKNKIDQVFVGNVIQAGNGQNVARQISLNLGLNFDTMATTVNAVCGSGMQSLVLAIQALKLNEATICLAGGVESLSQAPYLLKNHRYGQKYGNDTIIDSIINDGLFDNHAQISMLDTAENLASLFNISKKEQDLFAYHSHLKAINATNNNVFKNEIIEINDLTVDEAIRFDIDLAKIENLKPIKNTVSAANASGLNDGAALLVLMRKSDCLKMNLKPLAIIKDYVYSGCDNTLMGLSPYYAVTKLLDKTNTNLDDYDLIEMTEAFAAQSLAVIQKLNIDTNKLNVNGGALALGHPLGCSGARIVVSAIHELLRTNKKTALATLCIGGGNALAMAIEKYEEK